MNESEWLGRARRVCFRGRLDVADVGGPVLERGSGSVVWDVDGKAYLDFNAGQMCSALGHCHPRVVAARPRHATRAVSGREPPGKRLVRRRGSWQITRHEVTDPPHGMTGPCLRLSANDPFGRSACHGMCC